MDLVLSTLGQLGKSAGNRMRRHVQHLACYFTAQKHGNGGDHYK